MKLIGFHRFCILRNPAGKNKCVTVHAEVDWVSVFRKEIRQIIHLRGRGPPSQLIGFGKSAPMRLPHGNGDDFQSFNVFNTTLPCQPLGSNFKRIEDVDGHYDPFLVVTESNRVPTADRTRPKERCQS
ncbi:hypothetical protein D3C80_1532950 [compost metagenome]